MPQFEESQGINDSAIELSQDCVSADQEWLEYVRKTEPASDVYNLSWSAYHAGHSTKTPKHEDMSALLPVWREDSKSPAMIKHSMNIVKDVVEYLNPGQTPVCAFDQPLFALAKRIQWHQPDPYGKFVTMMGPLHTEMTFMSTIGDALQDSE